MKMYYLLIACITVSFIGFSPKSDAAWQQPNHLIFGTGHRIVPHSVKHSNTTKYVYDYLQITMQNVLNFIKNKPQTIIYIFVFLVPIVVYFRRRNKH